MKIFLLICAVCALTTAATLLFCLVRGSGPERKKLLHAVLLLGAAALLCFADGLSPMGRNLLMGGALLVTVYRCIKALEKMAAERDNLPMACFFSYVTLYVTMILIPVSMFLLTLSFSLKRL